DGIRDFHVTGVQTCALPILQSYLIIKSYVVFVFLMKFKKKFKMNNISTYVEQHKERFLNELIDLLKIPSISADSAYKKDVLQTRSEERRVGKECRYRWST